MECMEFMELVEMIKQAWTFRKKGGKILHENWVMFNLFGVRICFIPTIFLLQKI